MNADGSPKLDQSALIVVDVQNDFCEGGSLAVQGANEILPTINALYDSGKFAHVYFSLDWHPRTHVSFASKHPGSHVFGTITLADGSVQELWPDHCVAGTTGANLHALLKYDAQRDTLVKKGVKEDVDSYSAFGKDAQEDTGLRQALIDAGIKKVFIVGLAFDFCVGNTALSAALAGFDTYIVTDATRSVAPEFAAKMDERLKEHANIKKITSEDVDLYV